MRSAGRWLATAVLLMGAGGCGLSAYEEKMADEQKRIAAIDEANKLLADPVENPPLADMNPNLPQAGTNYVFFRPPRGIGPKYRTDAQGAAVKRGELLYEYPPVSRNLAAWQRQRSTEDTVFLNVFLAVATAKPSVEEWNQFATKVLQTFPNPDPSGDAKVTVRPDLEFRTRSFSEPPPEPNKPTTVYRAFFYQGTAYHVAIVYHLPLDQVKNDEVRKTFDYSLQSLALGADASTALGKWQRYHPKK